jgi:hypothetical protein
MNGQNTGLPGGGGNGNGGGARDNGGFYQLETRSIPKTLSLESAVSPINMADAPDIVYDALYDSVAVTSNTAAQPVLFSAIQASIFNGNLQGNAGQMPAPEAFLVEAIKFTVESNTSGAAGTMILNAVVTKEIFRRGTYQFTVSNKVYCRGKLIDFLDSKAPVVKDNAAAASEAYSYTANPFRSLHLPIRVPIPVSRTFGVKLDYTPGTFSTDTYRIFCYLIGFWYRSVQ